MTFILRIWSLKRYQECTEEVGYSNSPDHALQKGEQQARWNPLQESCRKSKIPCILEADESTRLRVERILRKNYEDHVTGKGSNSLHHYNLVHNFIPLPQALKIPAAEAAVDFLTFLSAWSGSVCDAIIQSVWWSAKRIGNNLRKSGVESGKSQKSIRSDQ